MPKKAASQEIDTKGQITPPQFGIATFVIEGDADYVSNCFPEEARQRMADKQRAGTQAAKGKKREPKDFDACYNGSMHKFPDGSPGIPATCFRKAMVSACRLVGFKMTIAKLALFIEADGLDKNDGTPLIRFLSGEPRRVDSYVVNETGVADIRPRAHFAPGWLAQVRVKYDSERFTETDIHNLMLRVGVQVGIGAGRPDSKQSTGMGWGTFKIVSKEETRQTVA